MSFKDKPLGYISNESYCLNERIEECKEMNTRSEVFRNYKIEKKLGNFYERFCSFEVFIRSDIFLTTHNFKKRNYDNISRF